MKGSPFKARIILMGVLNIAAAFAIILSRFIGGNADYLHGFGFGLLAVAFPILIFLIIRNKDKEYRENQELSLNDERVRRNCNRANALGFKLQSLLIIAAAVVSYFFEIELYYIVLGIVLVAVGFVKIYNRRLNKIA
ncbi:MAG: hypothetical protein JEZ04_18065 [Spirochaetales bacterium]|nr:hypothetical protein [Spirochaetales bacterium]